MESFLGYAEEHNDVARLLVRKGLRTMNKVGPG